MAMRERESRDRRYERLQAALRAYRAALLLSLILILILTSILLAGRGRFARAIKINGKVAVLVRNKAAADEVRKRLLKAGKDNLPGQASFKEQWEDVSWPVEGREVLPIGKALDVLGSQVTVLVGAAAIEVDGQEAVVLETKGLADAVLREVKRKYISEGDVVLDVKFRQDVRVAEVARPAAEILTEIGTAVEQLTASRTTPKTYVVKQGEYPWQIAQQHGMSVAGLYSLNPGVKGRYLVIGEKLTVAAPATPLTVVTVKEQTTIKELPPETQEIPRDSLPRGERQVVREGQAGKKKVWHRVVYENDRAIRTEPIKGVEIEKPVPKVVMVGTGPAAEERSGSAD